MGVSVNNPGAAATPPSTVGVDFGVTPTRSATFTVVDSSVSAASQIMAVQSADAPTGKSQDENEMDDLIFRCVAGAGQFTVYADALEGPVVGNYKMTYTVG
jgi:hypothetical protein